MLLLALGFRMLFLLAMPRVLDTADAIHYVETAEHLAKGNIFGYDPKIPPLYPFLGACAHWVIPDMEWACRMVSFFASVLTIIPVFLLARDLHGIGAARVSAFIFALWPWLADYACRVSTEATAVLFWFTALWLFTRGIRRGGWMLYASACTLPAAILLTWDGRRPHLKPFLPFAGVLVLLLIANTLYIRQLTGTTTANYRVGFILTEFDYLRFIQTTVQSFSDVLPVMLGPILFLFLGVGFFQHRDRTRDLRLELTVLLFATAQWSISLFVLSPAPRYLMTTLITLALWSACGIHLVASNLGESATTRRWARVPLLALLAFFLLHTLITVGSEHLGRRPREPREYKTAGQWMAKNLEPGLIFTRKPQVAFYAKMPSTGPVPEESLEACLQRARDAGAIYLVVDERYTAALVPALRPLLTSESLPDGLERLQVDDTYPQARVAIFAIAPDPDVAAP